MPHNPPVVTLDTNVYISGTTISASPPGQIIRAWEEEKLKIALSEPILAEIREVFSRPYFQIKLGWGTQEVNRYVDHLKFSAIVVSGSTLVNVCKDPYDNMLFSCALEANADYIVSGDRAVLEVGQFKRTLVISPRNFVDKVLPDL